MSKTGNTDRSKETAIGNVPEVKEFVSKTARDGSSVRKKAARAKKAYVKKTVIDYWKQLWENQSLLAICGYVVAVAVVIILSLFVCKLPVVAVCFIVLIDTLMAVCLDNLPVWLHGIVMVAQIVAGAIFAQILFMVMSAILYLLAILVLKVVRHR